MYQRLIIADKKKAKELKELQKKATNNIERKRIQILIQYMGGMNTSQVTEGMQISYQTVWKAVKAYKEKGNDFYKTNYKGRQENEENKKLMEQIKVIIDSGKNVDINEVRRQLERKNGEEYGYEKIHWLIRRKMGYNYQKPFVTSNKQSEFAKEITEGRLRKGLYQVAFEEGKIDAESVQNKKIKIGGAKG